VCSSFVFLRGLAIEMDALAHPTASKTPNEATHLEKIKSKSNIRPQEQTTTKYTEIYNGICVQLITKNKKTKNKNK